MRDLMGMHSGWNILPHSANKRSVKITPKTLVAFSGTPISTVERNAKSVKRNNKCERL